MDRERKLLIEVTVDWEDYEDVCDEILFDDVFRDFDTDGVELKLIKEQDEKD